MMNTAFLWVARAEGLSLLFLFGIAMPLKYGVGWEHATMVPGWIHGVLFMTYVGLVGGMALSHRWSFVVIALALLASLVPFGTIVFERRVLQDT